MINFNSAPSFHLGDKTRKRRNSNIVSREMTDSAAIFALVSMETRNHFLSVFCGVHWVAECSGGNLAKHKHILPSWHRNDANTKSKF